MCSWLSVLAISARLAPAALIVKMRSTTGAWSGCSSHLTPTTSGRPYFAVRVQTKLPRARAQAPSPLSLPPNKTPSRARPNPLRPHFLQQTKSPSPALASKPHLLPPHPYTTPNTTERHLVSGIVVTRIDSSDYTARLTHTVVETSDGSGPKVA